MATNPFAALVGQPQAVMLLQRAMAVDRIAPAYLFAGPAGVGRGLAARALAARLLIPRQGSADRELAGRDLSVMQRIEQGNHPDFLWVEPTYLHQGRPLTPVEAAELGLKRKGSPLIRLEQVRQIARFLARPPLEAARSLVVIDQAETMAEGPANALLKTLEEPGQATIVLLAPSSDRLLPTLVSRCQLVPFVRLGLESMATVLTQQGHGEVLAHPGVLAMAQGSPGSAIAAWQQRQTLPEDLLDQLQHPPATLQIALNLGKQIAQNLDNDAQLWLVDYLQQHYWQTHRSATLLSPLEAARLQLQRFVQPRLVWEVALMQLQAVVAPTGSPRTRR